MKRPPHVRVIVRYGPRRLRFSTLYRLRSLAQVGGMTGHTEWGHERISRANLCWFLRHTLDEHHHVRLLTAEERAWMEKYESYFGALAEPYSGIRIDRLLAAVDAEREMMQRAS